MAGLIACVLILLLQFVFVSELGTMTAIYSIQYEDVKLEDGNQGRRNNFIKKNRRYLPLLSMIFT